MSGYTAEALPLDQIMKAELALLPKPFTPADLCRKVRTVLSAQVRRPRVLVIDDEEPVRRVLRQTLERAGYEVLEAENGLGGTALLRSESVDLLVTDLVMPEQEGIETLKWVHEAHPALPVLVISGAVPAEFLSAASKLGASGTLSKPFAPEALLDQVRQLIGTA